MNITQWQCFLVGYLSVLTVHAADIRLVGMAVIAGPWMAIPNYYAIGWFVRDIERQVEDQESGK